MIQKGCRHFIQNGKMQNFAHCIYSGLTCLSVHINFNNEEEHIEFGLYNLSPL